MTKAKLLDKIKELKEQVDCLIKQLRRKDEEMIDLVNLVCENDDLKDEVFKLRQDKERLTALEIQLRDKIRELKNR